MSKNYFYNLLLTIFNIVFPILSFPYISRILGPSGVGKVQFVVTFAQYFALLAALGIPYYGVREISKFRANRFMLDKTFSELSIIYIFSSVILTVIYFILVELIPKLSLDFNFYLAGSLIVLFGFSAIDWFYQGLEEFKNIAIRSIVIKIFSLLGMYLFVKTKDDVLIFMWISVFAILGNNIINLFMLKNRVKFTFTDLNLVRHAKPLILIFSTNLSTAMYNMLDTILLGFFSNNQAVGFYTASNKMVRICVPVVVSMGIVLLPQITKSFANTDNKKEILLKESYNFIIVSAVPIVFGLIFLAPELIILMSGDQFSKAVLPMQIMACLPLVIGLANLFGVQILIASGHEAEMLKAVVFGVVISVVLNILLVPQLAEVGAAIANCITEIFVLAAFIYYTRKFFDVDFDVKLFLKAMISCIGFFPFIFFSRLLSNNPLFIVAFSFIFCGISYTSIQYIIFHDVYLKTVLDKINNKFLRF